MPCSLKRILKAGLGGRRSHPLSIPTLPNSSCMTRGNRVGQGCGAPHTTRPGTTACHLGAAHRSAVSLTHRPSGQHCHLVQNGHVLFSVSPTQCPGVSPTFRLAGWPRGRCCVIRGCHLSASLRGLFGRGRFRRQKPTWSQAAFEVQRLRPWGEGLSSFTLYLGPSLGIFPCPWAPPGYSALTPMGLGIFLKTG